MAHKSELVAIKNQLNSSQQKICDSLQTCSDLVSHPKLRTLQKVNGWPKLFKEDNRVGLFSIL